MESHPGLARAASSKSSVKRPTRRARLMATVANRISIPAVGKRVARQGGCVYPARVIGFMMTDGDKETVSKSEFRSWEATII